MRIQAMVCGLGLWCAAGAAEESAFAAALDVGRVGWTHTAEADMAAGGLALDRFELSSLLGRPLKPCSRVMLIPHFRYHLTGLDVSGPVGPLADEELHSLALSLGMVVTDDASPWVYGGFARAELATDFDHVDGDDFTYDLAAGVGYKFSDRLLVLAGVAAVNLNGDAAVYPGIALMWNPRKDWRVSLYGPIAEVTWQPAGDWNYGLRFEMGGGVWSVTDPVGTSRTIEFSNPQLGVYASRHLGGGWWLTAGVGMALGREIEYQTAGGSTLWRAEPDAALNGTIGLRLRSW